MGELKGNSRENIACAFDSDKDFMGFNPKG